MRPWIVAAVCVAFFTSPASADWQYTKWGMSAAQILSRAPNTANLRAPTVQEARGTTIQGVSAGLIGFHQSGSFEFIASLYFAGPSAGLSRVYLQLRDYAQLQQLLAALRGLYGEPTGQSSARRIWRDERGGNEIELLDMNITSTALINYTPLQSAKGL